MVRLSSLSKPKLFKIEKILSNAPSKLSGFSHTIPLREVFGGPFLPPESSFPVSVNPLLDWNGQFLDSIGDFFSGRLLNLSPSFSKEHIHCTVRGTGLTFS